MGRDLKDAVINKSVTSKHGKEYLKLHPLAIEEFEKMVEDDEEIVFVNSGAIKGRNRNGMVFITDKRVVVSLKLFFAHIEQFHYENITEVDYRINMLGQGVIEISSYGTDRVINFYDKGPDGEFLRQAVTYIKNKMLEFKQSKTQDPQKNMETDFITQLERLAKLKDQGIITESEFQEQKEKLLK